MRRTGLLTLGTVIALLGVLFTLQGVGVISGSAMSDTTFWSVGGPVIIVLGVVLVALGLRRRVH
jgi:RsiW-degrading membrane proteinase PrsW (M82 family)